MDRLWNYYRDHQELQPVRAAFLQGKLQHAYIFAGDRGIGGYAVALGFAGLLLRDLTEGDELDAMRQIMKHAFSDVILYPDTGERIGIDDVKELQRKIFQTRQMSHRLVLIEHIERMTSEAANSFLKTLEEPPEQTIYLMTTSSYESLLPTITSRAQKVPLLPCSASELRSYIQELGVEASMVDMIVDYSFGLPDIARRMAEDAEFAEQWKSYVDFANSFANKEDSLAAIRIIEQIHGDKEQVLLFLQACTYVFRALLSQASDGAQTRALATRLASLIDARTMVYQNVHKRLLLENLLLLS